jgi:hypothetical protein
LKIFDVEYGAQNKVQAKAIAIYPLQAHIVIRTQHEPIWEGPLMHYGICLKDFPEANDVEAVARIFSGTCASQYILDSHQKAFDSKIDHNEVNMQ